MIDKDNTSLIKLDIKNKAAVYDILFSKADSCLKTSKTVALLYLGSPYYMRRLLEEYNNIEVYVFTIKEFKFIYEPFENNRHIKIWYVDDEKDTFKGCDMKFDCIIMNPPYDGQLYRKILIEAIKHRAKNGECVCLAPSLYTNYKNNKNMKMLPSTYEIISSVDASKLFNGIQLQDSLLITTWNNKNHLSEKEIYDQFVPIGFNVVKKLKFRTSFNNVNILNYTNEKYFVPLKLMTAQWDKNKDIIIDKLGLLIDGHTLNGQYYKDARSKNKDRPCGGIAFKTKNEAINFINSCNTIFFKFLVKMLHTNSRYILKDYPFMEDYTQPWTDERFYKFFNITPEEQKIIEDTMEKQQ